MTGPNSGPGHNSLLVYVQGQIDYAVRGITTILEQDLRYLDVRKEVQGATTTGFRAAGEHHLDVGVHQLVPDRGRLQRRRCIPDSRPSIFARCRTSGSRDYDVVDRRARHAYSRARQA